MASPRRVPRLLAPLLALAFVVVSTAGLASPASADPPRAVPLAAAGQPPTRPYLALGDSVPFGFTPSAATPPASYLDASSFAGYPERVARHGLRPLANASCPGETSGSLIDVTAPSNGCTNTAGAPGGYRAAFPLHVDYAGSQLDYAVDRLRAHPRTRLVTLTVGANDLFLCQRLTASGCTGEDLAAVLRQVGANVSTIVSALRSEAGYRHRIVVVTYYSLDYSDPVFTGAISALNDAVVAAARPYRIRVADGFGAFARAAQASGGDSCAAGLLFALPAGGCDIHPSVAGHRLLARAVVRTLWRP